jgi:8-oxo-dGTP diphosphatase
MSMEIRSFELSDIKYSQIKYVVLLTEYKNELVMIRHKDRTLWELPGGKREEGELILEAASRELYEETGAISFELIPYGIYWLNGSYGINFYAKIIELGVLPDYEIAEIKLSRSLPAGLNYGAIYYKLYDDWNVIKSKKDFKTYKINYKDAGNKFDF